MSFDLDAALAAVDEHFDEFVTELQELCRFRSRRHEPDQMVATADFLKGSLERWGGEGHVVPWEQSHPYVHGEIAGGAPRLLHFCHYDVEVEPTGDDAEWIVPPYSAEIVDGRLYARGVADDKGAIMSRIHAAAAWRLSGQEPPVTSRYILEGKQWLHSPGLGSFVEAHHEQLEADVALWENSWLDSEGRLLLKLSEKGVLYLRLSVRTISRELTSQNTALLHSATARLVSALSTLVDANGDCTVPGFTDGIAELSPREQELLDALPFPADFLLERAGVSSFRHGEDARAAATAIRTVPTLTISSLNGGDDSQDVTLGIPATATAKIEVRLIAGQDPDVVLAAIQKHLVDGGFGDVEVDVMATSRPNRTDPDHPFVDLVARTAREVYGTEPVIEPFTQWIGNQGVMPGLPDLPIVGVGVSRADAGIDGPNEHIRLEDYRNGIKHVVAVMAELAREAAE
ncbi:M20/M25/M40 family metallo-hydrolase [Nocardioides marmotae]|uniref:M20/M25/M40 family metallo-hydrolase n=1 Tax=Nocardioides marmotae TaxID=2663857 RepID=A0A6I3J7P4_9ACTN|nr:M20/M25/M40 family metallo-hydrolase [Nocardioides marmotae]MCR6030503.1 M20/M25/M40 family metallo-hydrolase [Gordonia jinghuaiqii]MBC9734634.1 M20/M25/M40 family metallo-hydrolase [Nocardioides marmotae]MTB85736.1 M20/M25/M40 family metallo-hydrolase [Nocardioides marmotae]MTB94139.1 M20/M25/M40 family metallo-hydrolase [Nocardioides marmotae]QKE00435.1 M20/M25/M40 family metallo-hydrolase [Nocardioides marmotae]